MGKFTCQNMKNKISDYDYTREEILGILTAIAIAYGFVAITDYKDTSKMLRELTQTKSTTIARQTAQTNLDSIDNFVQKFVQYGKLKAFKDYLKK